MKNYSMYAKLLGRGLLAACSYLGISLAQAADKPNILFIAVDDLVPTLGCYGDPIAITPKIDALAAQGTTFLNHHCAWSVCGPSRVALSTSLMPEETGVTGFRAMRHPDYLPNVITMPQYFKDNGYETVCRGKYHDHRTVGDVNKPLKSNQQYPDGNLIDDPLSWSIPFIKHPAGYSPANHPGWDDNPNQPEANYGDAKILAQAKVQIDALSAGNKPFFLAVGFKKPHLPFIAPHAYWQLYNRADMPLALFQNLPLGASTPASSMLTNNTEIEGYEDPEAATPTNYAVPLTPAQQRGLIHGYYASTSWIDKLVGDLRAYLATKDDPIQESAPGVKKKMSETTIVVLWGDHGFHLGDHGKWAKHTNMQRATFCPLIIFDPRHPTTGAKTNSPVSTLDIFPTLCELAEIPIPLQPMDNTPNSTGRPLKGRSLKPILDDATASVRIGATNLFKTSGNYGYSFRTKRFRLIEWVNNSGSVSARELYDYETDPLETKNLAGEPAYEAIVYQLSRALRADPSMQGDNPDLGNTRLQQSSAISAGGNAYLPFITMKNGATSGTAVLSWPEVGGQTFNILSNTDLSSNWPVFVPNQVGSSYDYTIPSGEMRRFFRVGIGSNTPPRWHADPLVKANATKDAAYSGSLASDVSDPDAGSTLTFSKISGPAWLSIAANGTLTGTPTTSNADYFRVQVTDDQGASILATLQITVEDASSAPMPTVYVESDFANEAANTGLTSLDVGTDSFDTDLADAAEADGLGNLMIGDDPGANNVTNAITADANSTLSITGAPLSNGVYVLEFRIADWQLTTATSNGIELHLRDANGTQLKTIFNSKSGGSDVRIRVVETGTGGLSGQKAGFGTTGSEGVTIRTTVDFNAGTWKTDYKLDSDASFSSAVSAKTISSDFTDISQIRLQIEGSTPWGTGDFVSISSLKFTKNP